MLTTTLFNSIQYGLYSCLLGTLLAIISNLSKIDTNWGINDLPKLNILLVILSIYIMLDILLSMLNWLSPLGSTSRRTEERMGSDSGSPSERNACVKSCV